MSKRHSNEIVHEGWLTKSPPTQRLWRVVSRWRRRWFVLRQGELPAQYWLEYYTDKKCLKLKGRIDLDQCEQVHVAGSILRYTDRSKDPCWTVDAGIESPAHLRVKCRENLFDLKTPQRTYYLAADSKAEMDKWVECVCRVCGLRAEMDNTYGSVEVEELSYPPLSEPAAPASGHGSAYICISECYSGQPPPGVLTKQLEAQIASLTARAQKPTRLCDAPPPAADFYDMPRTLAAPPPSGGAADDDVFTWDLARAPSVNWDTFPRDSVSELSLKRASESSEASTEEQPSSAELGALVAARSFSRPAEEVPPRPPKPSHLAEVHSYLNIESVLENRASAPTRPAPRSPDGLDDLYDFPRTHPVAGRNCYSNAAATTSCTAAGATVFHFELSSEPGTPRSDDSELGSPPPPPSVHRDLKPRKQPDEPPVPSPAPSVDRALKPRHRNTSSDSPDAQAFRLAAPPTQRGAEGRQRSQRAAPSPTPPGTFGPVGVFIPGNSCSDDSDEGPDFFHIVNRTFVPATNRGLDKLKYLDLDLEMGGASSGLGSRQPSKSTLSLGPPTIYNTVDFVKTQAFNRTRKEIENKRQLPH